jgi:hypothetical protein
MLPRGKNKRVVQTHQFLFFLIIRSPVLPLLIAATPFVVWNGLTAAPCGCCPVVCAYVNPNDFILSENLITWASLSLYPTIR